MRSIQSPEDVTLAVQAVMQQTTDSRLREIMTSLVKHVHGFILETRLTEAEFRQATSLINELGQRSNDSHNEAVLMAGSLGVSQLVCLLNNGGVVDGDGSIQTTQNLLGPFWRMHSPRTENGGSILRSPTSGEALRVEGFVVDGSGCPIADAEVDIWHASPVGLYEQQDETQADMNLRGKFTTDAKGRFWFTTVKPRGYPIPTDGVVGRLLKAQNRHPYRPAHLHALIFKQGFKTLISQVYADDDEHLGSDVQFGVTRATTGQFEKRADGSYLLQYTYVMQAGEAVLPNPPIK
ncbi:MAG: dioxygenase [Cytophagales bacterium]|nr:dioxygenase [Cytophagales bacterium]